MPSEEVQLVQVQADAEVARVAVGRVANTSELLLRVACSSWHVRDAWSAKEASSPRPSVFLELMGTSLSERIIHVPIFITTKGIHAIRDRMGTRSGLKRCLMHGRATREHNNLTGVRKRGGLTRPIA